MCTSHEKRLASKFRSSKEDTVKSGLKSSGLNKCDKDAFWVVEIYAYNFPDS